MNRSLVVMLVAVSFLTGCAKAETVESLERRMTDLEERVDSLEFLLTLQTSEPDAPAVPPSVPAANIETPLLCAGKPAIRDRFSLQGGLSC